MKTLVYAAIAVAGSLGSIPAEAGQGTDERAYEIADQADFVAQYSADGRIGIGITVFNEGTRTRETRDFSLEDLEAFFDSQRHKDLIVVQIAKNMWDRKKVQSEVVRLRDYFVKRGYKRVCIQQHAGFPTFIRLDHVEPRNRPNKAAHANPLPAPSRKSNENHKP